MLYLTYYFIDFVDLSDSDSESITATDSESQSCLPAAKRQNLSSSMPVCGDVANYVKTRLNTDQRYTNHFKPGVNYSFPKRANGRSFQLRWLQQYLGLFIVARKMVGIVCLVFCSLRVATMRQIQVSLLPVL